MVDIPRKENHGRDNLPKDHLSKDHQARDHAAADKASQNIQDVFLNTLRKERAYVTIFLMGGVKLTGRIKSFDKYSVMLESNSQEQLVFKHAISTVVVNRPAPQPAPAAPQATEA